MDGNATCKEHADEIRDGKRYAFGANWSRFLRLLDEQRIKEAERSLKDMLGVKSLAGQSFLDVGSGSGLFSLAARRLGAKVFSFDYDPESVACTAELRRRYFPEDEAWMVQGGSVLDKAYLSSLGQFDIVYSWGVLHHTGNMWSALNNVDSCVRSGGLLYVALYNHQPFATSYWTVVKRWYNSYRFARPLLVGLHMVYPTFPSVLLKYMQRRRSPRGMSVWYDLHDWLGGYPFETSKPEQVFDFYKQRGYVLSELVTVGGRMGCNEFVFLKGPLQCPGA